LKAATARAITEAEKEEERVSRQEREQEAIEQVALKTRAGQEALQRHEVPQLSVPNSLSAPQDF